jgi:hypothetical protein
MLTSSNPSSPKPRRSAASVISRSRPHCAGKHERIVHAVLLAPEAAPAGELALHQHRPRPGSRALPLIVLGRAPARGRFVGEPGAQPHVPPITGLVAQLKPSGYRHLGEPDELDPKILTSRRS